MAEPVVPPPTCTECGDRGWIVSREAGQGFGVARRCDCQKRQRTELLLEQAGIPERYRRCRFEGFNTAQTDQGGREQLQGALADSKRYIEEFLRPDGGFQRHGLIYIGPPGVGKTHLAVAVLTELMRSYQLAGRFIDFTTLIHQIQSSFDPDSDESKRKILDPVIQAPLLVLDELGAQKPTPWVQDILYLLVNGRYTRRLPTFFTTNYSLEEPVADRPREFGAEGAAAANSLARRMPPALLSRLCEMARPIQMAAVEDFRRAVKMKQLEKR